MQATTVLASAGMLLLSTLTVITVTVTVLKSELYIQSTSIDNSTVVSNMHSSGHDDDGNYVDDYYDDDYYDDDYYDDEDDLLISSSNSTNSLSPRTMMAPYLPKIPDSWDRACLYTRGKKPFAVNAEKVQVYSREWDTVEPKHCGRGLLDNLRGECGSQHFRANRVLHWECRRFEKNGILASFKIHLSSDLSIMYDTCIEVAFQKAAGAERVPQDIVCCPWDDLNCLNESPGHDPRDNLAIADEIWIGHGAAPTNYPKERTA